MQHDPLGCPNPGALHHAIGYLLHALDHEESGWEARDDLTAIAIDDSWVAASETPVEAAG